LELFLYDFSLFFLHFQHISDTPHNNSQSIIAKPRHQKDTEKHRVLHQKSHFRKTDIDTKKQEKRLQTLAKSTSKEESQNVPCWTNFPLIFVPKSIRNGAQKPLKKASRNHTLKNTKIC
jgi:hypothetical protein